MDKEKKKRTQKRRLILTEGLMVLSVIIMVVILTFVAMGYKVGMDGTVGQSGLIQVNSFPTGATVTIDGDELFARTNMSRMLSEGGHTVELKKDGYDTWAKTVAISPGLLYKLDYPRLFRTEGEDMEVEKFDDELEFINVAPDQSGIIYAEKGEENWKYVNIRGDDTKVAEIAVREYVGADVETVTWNNNGDKIIVEWRDGESHGFSLIDVRKNEASLDLTKEFGMDFAKVVPANDSAEKLYVLQDGNLRQISVGGKEISSVMATNVADFTNDRENLLFATEKDEDGEREIRLYRDGDKESVVLKNTESENVRLVLSEYLDEKYIGMALDEKIYIYKGQFPVTEISNMTEVAKKEVPDEVSEFFEYNNGRLIVAKSKSKVLAFNSELFDMNEFALEGEWIGFLDGFLIGTVSGEKLYVQDFDGENRREIVDGVLARDDSASISKNGKWLYYVAENGKSLRRKQI